MFWYQGKLREGNTLEIKITDPGLLYGATVFTTMRIYNHDLNHELTNWSLHRKRLISGLEDFGWNFPNWDAVLTGINHLISIYPIVRIAIFPDGNELIIGRNLPEKLTQKQKQGIIGYLTDKNYLIRSLPIYKTGNYLAPWLALQDAQKNGAQEGILIDINHNWLETSTGNLWGYKKGVYYTPSLESGILPGVIRTQLLTWLNTHNIPVIENVWTPDFVQDLELIAYSNSAVEIIPFRKIIDNNYIYNSQYLDNLINYFGSSRVMGTN
jgi:4-amino-4-deoxychorismate lyase